MEIKKSPKPLQLAPSPERLHMMEQWWLSPLILKLP